MFGPFHPPAENLDAMIAMQTKNKLGKALGLPDFTRPNGTQFILQSWLTYIESSNCIVILLVRLYEAT